MCCVMFDLSNINVSSYVSMCGLRGKGMCYLHVKVLSHYETYATILCFYGCMYMCVSERMFRYLLVIKRLYEVDLLGHRSSFDLSLCDTPLAITIFLIALLSV